MEDIGEQHAPRTTHSTALVVLGPTDSPQQKPRPSNPAPASAGSRRRPNALQSGSCEPAGVGVAPTLAYRSSMLCEWAPAVPTISEGAVLSAAAAMALPPHPTPRFFKRKLSHRRSYTWHRRRSTMEGNAAGNVPGGCSSGLVLLACMLPCLLAHHLDARCTCCSARGQTRPGLGRRACPAGCLAGTAECVRR